MNTKRLIGTLVSASLLAAAPVAVAAEPVRPGAVKLTPAKPLTSNGTLPGVRSGSTLSDSEGQFIGGILGGISGAVGGGAVGALAVTAAIAASIAATLAALEVVGVVNVGLGINDDDEPASPN